MTDEKVSFLRKSNNLKNISENRLFQIILVFIVGYLIASNSKPRSDFDACFDTGVKVFIENSSDSKLSKIELEKKAREASMNFCGRQK